MPSSQETLTVESKKRTLSEQCEEKSPTPKKFKPANAVVKHDVDVTEKGFKKNKSVKPKGGEPLISTEPSKTTEKAKLKQKNKKKKKKQKAKQKQIMSDDRLKAYGINPKKFKYSYLQNLKKS